jgi:hypothetical protein
MVKITGDVTFIDLRCGKCSFDITNPKCAIMVDNTVAIICPNCDYHHTLELPEKAKKHLAEKRTGRGI